MRDGTPVADSAEKSYSPLLALCLSRRADLVRFFSIRTGSSAEAEDIVQETCLKIAAMDDSGVENPAAYLYRLGSNVMLDRARARRRATLRDDAYYQTFSAGSHGEAEADAPSPEETTDARRRLARLMDSVRDLPPQCRRVFVMHKIEGLSHGEVAEALGLSRSAVEKHMIAALKRLAEHRP